MTENQRAVIESVATDLMVLAGERSGEIVERLRDNTRKLRGMLAERQLQENIPDAPKRNFRIRGRRR